MNQRHLPVLVVVAVLTLLLIGGALHHGGRLIQAAQAAPTSVEAICHTCHNEVRPIVSAQEEGDGDGEGAAQDDDEAGAAQDGEAEAQVPSSTADHSQYEILQQDFATAPEVTEACLSCHNQADMQLHATTHWNWEFEHPVTGELLGKQHVINNSTLSIAGNKEYCATCHNGYGFSGEDFDFTSARNIDCLSCHDTTGDYAKLPGAAGNPAYTPTEYPPGSGNIRQPPDLTRIAQQVGSTSRQTCGSCHFNEQNVEPVIHGHLPHQLSDPPPELDVHMGTEHLDFSCATCHEPQNHDFWASQYYPVSLRDDVPEHLVHTTCVSCHTGQNVHRNDALNQHMDRVACQSCHIPEYGRAGPTMTSWDWSTAGRTDDQGNPIVERNAEGLLIYDSRYGSFAWDTNIVPEYVWTTGIISYTQVGDTFDPTAGVTINQIQGSYDDPNAQLWPVSRFRGIQPYDSENNYLVAVDLYAGEQADDPATAFWETFDWNAAIQAGMALEGVPYSGQYDFIETQRYWMLNHSVAPADQAVSCGACHSRDGRLAGLSGSYVPGRDYNRLLDSIGWMLLAGVFLAVLFHAFLRFLPGRMF